MFLEDGAVSGYYSYVVFVASLTFSMTGFFRRCGSRVWFGVRGMYGHSVGSIVCLERFHRIGASRLHWVVQIPSLSYRSKQWPPSSSHTNLANLLLCT